MKIVKKSMCSLQEAISANKDAGMGETNQVVPRSSLYFTFLKRFTISGILVTFVSPTFITDFNLKLSTHFYINFRRFISLILIKKQIYKTFSPME